MSRTHRAIGLSAGILLLGIVGCAGSVPASRDTAPPAAAVAAPPREEGSPASERMLVQLQEKRDALRNEISALSSEADRFRAEHPESFVAPDLIPERLKQISREHVNAQMATIAAKAEFSAGHPSVKAAARREEALHAMFEQELDRAVQHEGNLARLKQLEIEIAAKQELARRIDEQIAAMEVASPASPRG